MFRVPDPNLTLKLLDSGDIESNIPSWMSYNEVEWKILMFPTRDELN